MRRLLFLAALLVATAAQADREITVPKGKKMLDGMFRTEILGLPGENATRLWFGAGFLKAFDAEITLSQSKTQDWAGSFDLSYNYSPPITDIAPGVSIGIQDALGHTEQGRAVYFATTYRYGNEGDLNQNVPTEVTFGLWSRKSGLFFFAVRLPVSERFILIGEHDSERLAGGFEVRPFDGLVFKTVFESGGTMFGLALNRRF